MSGNPGVAGKTHSSAEPLVRRRVLHASRRAHHVAGTAGLVRGHLDSDAVTRRRNPASRAMYDPRVGRNWRMKRALMIVVLAGVVSVPVLAALKQGEKAPDFSARASLAWKEFAYSLKDALKKGPVVVYFYPSAYTGGFNVEAHTFSVNKEKFDA